MSKISPLRILQVVTLAFVAVFLLNAAIIFFAKPGNEQRFQYPDGGFAYVEEMEVAKYDNLRSGGIQALGLVAKTRGYVNMLSEDNKIFITSREFDEPTMEALVRHERGHVLQKQMVAAKTGGYPSVWHPTRSIVFYYHLVTLNQELEAVMPETNRTGFAALTAGLEIGAECYSQPESSPDEPAVFFASSYLKGVSCSAEEKAAAQKLEQPDVWFAPLTAAEKATLQPVNITATNPNFDFAMLMRLGILTDTAVDMSKAEYQTAMKKLHQQEQAHLIAQKSVQK